MYETFAPGRAQPCSFIIHTRSLRRSQRIYKFRILPVSMSAYTYSWEQPIALTGIRLTGPLGPATPGSPTSDNVAAP